ncbi:hypothetical protein [Lichenibacterium ramalinae]|uniref:Histidine kinase n=1 Tax=Lichenibacterium ramalinae TaxID=2316527 RepID=A0A4Q2RGB8_9HYPH|nr:hypothetical protein [Lichenibacterium ramalinae]RYB04743.1 hypothetical protein D3272_12425 [Lichenibacterium ramalinae]
MRFDLSRSVAVAMVLTLAPMAAWAKSTTVNGITLDVPDGYKVSSSKRGVLVKSPDDEVDVWVETFEGADTQTLLGEHAAYWDKEKVDLHGNGITTTGKSGDANVSNTDFPDATWKGDPTVLRYSAIGPYGSKNKMVLVTYWASPGGDKDFGGAIQTMIGDIGFKFEK